MIYNLLRSALKEKRGEEIVGEREIESVVSFRQSMTQFPAFFSFPLIVALSYHCRSFVPSSFSVLKTTRDGKPM